jgi:maleylacetoacetate isomerase
MKQVPLLEIDGKKLTQSLAIIQYLEATRPEVPVVPKDPYFAAKMWEICEIINSGIQPLQNLSLLNKIAELGGDNIALVTEAISKGLAL